MLSFQDLKQKLKELFHTSKQFEDPSEIFQLFINEDLSVVTNAKTEKQTVCGGSIEMNSLSFQCYTCTVDPHHMICKNCFIKEKHQGHKCIMRHNIGGCCDCGDEKTMPLSSFCENHKGFHSADLSKEIDKIPKDIQRKLLSFIEFILAYTYKLTLKSNIQSFQQQGELQTILGIIDKLKVEQIQKLFNDEGFNIQDDEMSKDTIHQATYNYIVCFSLIRWLIDDNMAYVNLITGLLMKPITMDVAKELNLQHSLLEHTYLENLLKFSVLIENNGKSKPLSNEDIYFKFHTNDQFKAYLQETIQKMYKSLFAKFSIASIENQDTVLQMTQRLKQAIDSQGDQLRQTPQFAIFISQYQTQCQQYITQLKQQQKQEINVYRIADVHEHHTQYVSNIYQVQFFLSPYINSVYEQFAAIYSEMTQIPLEKFEHVFKINYIFRLRVEYSFFPDICAEQLKKLLGDKQSQELQNTLILPSQLPFKYFDQFTLTRLLQCLSSQQPCQNEQILQGANKINSLLYYLFSQSQMITLITGAIKRIQEATSVSTVFKQNIANSMLFWAYKFVQKRNETKIEKVTECYKGPGSETEFNRLTMNATTIDRIFSFFLTFAYFQQQPRSVDEFLQFLTKILDQDKLSILNTVSLAVERAVQSYMTIQYDHQVTQNGLYNLYNGAYNQEFENLQSIDIALIKMSLYIFGSEGISNLLRCFQNQTLPDRKQCDSQRLLLQIILSDQDLLNVCGSQFTILPIDLKFHFRKIVISIFNLKNYFAFNSLKGHLHETCLIQSLKFSNYVLEVCELDNTIKKLKLKPIFNQKLYEPIIFTCSKKLEGKLLESFMESKGEQIDPVLGNFFEYDLKTYGKDATQTMGPIRYNIFQTVLRSPDLLKLLTPPNQAKDIEVINRLIFIYALGLCHFNIQDQQIINHITLCFEQTLLCQKNSQTLDKQTTNQQHSYINKVQKTLDILNKKNILDDESELKRKQQLKEQVQLQKTNSYESMKNKFKQKQTLFENKNLETKTAIDPQNVVHNYEFDLCQGCKLEIQEDSTNICFPILIQSTNIHQYFKFLSEEYIQNGPQLVLTSCKHKFHLECLRQNFNKIKGDLPIWVVLCCPLCKQSLNTTMPIVKPNDFVLTKEYFQSLLMIVNTNEELANLFFEPLQTECLEDQENFVFIDSNLSILWHEIFLLVANSSEFKSRSQHNILRNLLTLNKNFIIMQGAQAQQKIKDRVQQSQNKLIHSKPIQQYLWQGIIDYLTNGDNNQKNLINKITRDLIIESFEKEDNKQTIKNIFTIFYDCLNETSLQVPDQQINLKVNKDSEAKFEGSQYNYLKQKLALQIRTCFGTSFKVFYEKFFLKGCSACISYPLQYQANEKSAELFVCLLCSTVLCPGSCKPERLNEIGNLNNHAIKYHQNTAIYICLQNGQIALVSSPITIFKYKTLFFDNLGQTLNILESKEDWESFKLDDGVLNEILDIILKQNQRSIVRGKEVLSALLDVYGKV